MARSLGIVVVGVAASVTIVLVGTARNLDPAVAAAMEAPRSPDFLPEGEEWMRVVMFIDVECAACVLKVPRYGDVLEGVRTQWSDRAVRLEVRHALLQGRCNGLSDLVGRRSCRAAAELEAQRQLSSDQEVFASAVRMLRASNEASRADAGAIPDTLAAESSTLLQRVNDDVRLAFLNGIRATPTVFVNGARLVAPAPADLQAAITWELQRLNGER